MTTTTPLPAAALPQTSPEQAARVLAGQLTAYLAQLRDLRDADWTRPTDCAWLGRPADRRARGRVAGRGRAPARHAPPPAGGEKAPAWRWRWSTG